MKNCSLAAWLKNYSKVEIPGAGDLHVSPNGEVSFTMLPWAKKTRLENKGLILSMLGQYRASRPTCCTLTIPKPRLQPAPYHPAPEPYYSHISSVPFSKPAVPGSSWHCPLCPSIHSNNSSCAKLKPKAASTA